MGMGVRPGEDTASTHWDNHMLEQKHDGHDGAGVNVITSHWNRYKVRDEGTGISWNKEMNKWEAKIVRNLGTFDSIVEAAAVLEKHVMAVETHLLEEFLSDEDTTILPPTAVYLDSKAFEVGRQVSRIEQRKHHREQ